jgi:hypothetical protein
MMKTNGILVSRYSQRAEISTYTNFRLKLHTRNERQEVRRGSTTPCELERLASNDVGPTFLSAGMPATHSETPLTGC